MSDTQPGIDLATRTEALESLLVERGLADAKTIETFIGIYETQVGPLNGAKVVARAWTDAEYRERLLSDGTAAVAELGFKGPDVERVSAHLTSELVFAEPWQGRAFGLVMTLTEQGVLSYDDFRHALVARIAAWEADPPVGEPYSYYRCWSQALEQALDAQALVPTTEIDARAAALAARPAGHDHDHEDEHHHH